MIDLYKLNTLANKKNYPFYVIYFLSLNNDEIYIGITKQTVQNRVNQHLKGKRGSIHTKNKKLKILKIIPLFEINISKAAYLENRASKLTQKIIKNKKVWGGLFY